jgi:polysaccharide export outer membrane protein
MRADQSQNIWLKPGDTIFMPDNKDQRVFVFGAGKTGMSIPFPPRGLNLLEAIAIAGLQEIGYHSQNVHLIRSLSPTRDSLWSLTLRPSSTERPCLCSFVKAMSFTFQERHDQLE